MKELNEMTLQELFELQRQLGKAIEKRLQTTPKLINLEKGR